LQKEIKGTEKKKRERGGLKLTAGTIEDSIAGHGRDWENKKGKHLSEG